MARIRANFVKGVVENSPVLTDDGTTLSSSVLSGFPVVEPPDLAAIVIDPLGTPEIVYIIEHEDSATTATISRGREGTSALEHLENVPWIHAPTAADFGRLDPDDPFAWGEDLGFDYEFENVGTSLPSGWSWMNKGGATYVERMGGGYVALPQSNSENWRGIVNSLNGAPDSWVIVAKLSWVLPVANYSRVGLIVHDTTGGRMAFMGCANDNPLVAENWQSVSSAGTGSTIGTATSSHGFLAGHGYFKIQKNSSTSYDFAYSSNCTGWRTIGSGVNLSTNMTPNAFGFAASTSSNTANPGGVTCHWIRLRELT